MFSRPYYADAFFHGRYFPSGASQEIRVPDLFVRRGYEGSQVVVNWTPPPDNEALEIRILRKLGGYPDNVADGVVLVTEATPFTMTSYSDQDVQPGVVYYYRMFIKVEP